MPKNQKKMKQIVVKPRKKRAPPAGAKQVTLMGQALRSLGGLGGGALGSLLGSPAIGANVGTSLGGAISKWLGAGDYNVSANSVVRGSLKAASSIPSMHQDGQNIVVRHKEYLGEVKSSIGFSVQQSYNLNPGLSHTFPWLSGIANKFQEYRIRGMVFHYIPTSGSAVSSVNAALGSVMLQTTYRSTDVAPSSKVEMLNEYCSNESVPSESFCHPIECDPKENPFNVQYVRTGAVGTNETQLMYDLGSTHVAVSGCQSDGNTLGDLWVTYEVELKKPLVASNVTSTVASASDFRGASASLSPTTLFGTSQRTMIGSLPVVMNVNTLTFPKGSVGKFLVWYAVTGSSCAMTAPTYTCTGCAVGTWIAGTSVTTFNTITTSTVNTFAVGIEITEPNLSPSIVVTFPGSPTWTGPTGMYISISSIA
nr:MAG: capsid protein [Crogonang virus 164]